MPVGRLQTQLSWTDYHQSVRRISAKHNPNHGNYRIHDHEFVEIALITGGTCLHHSVLGDSHPAPGDVFLFRPGAWHGYADAQNLSLYNCCFDTVLLGRELAWTADDPYLGQLLWSLPLSPKQQGMVALHLTPPEFERSRLLLDQLQSLARKNYQSHYGDHLGLLTQFLNLLARNAAAGSVRNPAKSHRAVAAALKLLDEAPTEPWTITSLANRIHIESTYFVRLFHNIVGLPPMAYLNRRRLELATQMLRRADLSIGQVGEISGWVDSNYFSRCFRQHFGMTPSKYRTRYVTNEKNRTASEKRF